MKILVILALAMLSASTTFAQWEGLEDKIDEYVSVDFEERALPIWLRHDISVSGKKVDNKWDLRISMVRRLRNTVNNLAYFAEISAGKLISEKWVYGPMDMCGSSNARGRRDPSELAVMRKILLTLPLSLRKEIKLDSYISVLPVRGKKVKQPKVHNVCSK